MKIASGEKPVEWHVKSETKYLVHLFIYYRIMFSFHLLCNDEVRLFFEIIMWLIGIYVFTLTYKGKIGIFLV